MFRRHAPRPHSCLLLGRQHIFLDIAILSIVMYEWILILIIGFV